MINWFTVKVRYTKQFENGEFKRVSEPYLFAAATFTDAEARTYEEVAQFVRGDFDVVSIARTEIHDIFKFDDAETWYKCKVTYEREEGEGAKAKKVSQNFLVSAHSVKDAFDRMQESLKGLMVDFQIPTIAVSPIIDIFPMAEDLDREISRKPIAEMQEEEDTDYEPKGVVFSASGSDLDDEDEEEIEEITEEDENED